MGGKFLPFSLGPPRKSSPVPLARRNLPRPRAGDDGGDGSAELPLPSLGACKHDPWSPAALHHAANLQPAGNPPVLSARRLSRLHCTTPCCAWPSCAILCHSMLCCAISCHAILIPCHAILCRAMLQSLGGPCRSSSRAVGNPPGFLPRGTSSSQENEAWEEAPAKAGREPGTRPVPARKLQPPSCSSKHAQARGSPPGAAPALHPFPKGAEGALQWDGPSLAPGALPMAPVPAPALGSEPAAAPGPRGAAEGREHRCGTKPIVPGTKVATGPRGVGGASITRL